MERTRNQQPPAQDPLFEERIRRFFGYLRRFRLYCILSLAAVCVLFLFFFDFLVSAEDGTLLPAAYYEAGVPRSVSCTLLESSVYCKIPGELLPVFSAKKEIPVPVSDKKGTEGFRGEEQSFPLDPIDEDSSYTPIPWETLYQAPPAAAAGKKAIVPVDLSLSSLYSEENGSVLFSDQTDYSVRAEDFLYREYPIGKSVGEDPLVLIVHTHGTESYAPEGVSSVGNSYSARSQDPNETVVAVGDVLFRTLTAYGIPAIHCETMFDLESFPLAYQNSADYIRKTVEKYPSIRYIFDVHRDALESGDGSVLCPLTQVMGEKSAQVMCVVGTNAAGADHPGWRDNMTVAVRLQSLLNKTYERFARPINVRSATFNGQYAPGAMILEIGSSGNTLGEAKTAARALGTVLAALISG